MHVKVSFALSMHVHWRAKIKTCDGNPNYTYFEKQCGQNITRCVLFLSKHNVHVNMFTTITSSFTSKTNVSHQLQGLSGQNNHRQS